MEQTNIMVLSAGAIFYSSIIRCSFDAAPSSAGAAFDAALPPRDSMNNDTPKRCCLLVCVDEISLPQFQEQKLKLVSIRENATYDVAQTAIMVMSAGGVIYSSNIRCSI